LPLALGATNAHGSVPRAVWGEAHLGCQENSRAKTRPGTMGVCSRTAGNSKNPIKERRMSPRSEGYSRRRHAHVPGCAFPIQAFHSKPIREAASLRPSVRAFGVVFPDSPRVRLRRRPWELLRTAYRERLRDASVSQMRDGVSKISTAAGERVPFC
jgi:hypothetical protein